MSQHVCVNIFIKMKDWCAGNIENANLLYVFLTRHIYLNYISTVSANNALLTGLVDTHQTSTSEVRFTSLSHYMKIGCKTYEVCL